MSWSWRTNPSKPNERPTLDERRSWFQRLAAAFPQKTVIGILILLLLVFPPTFYYVLKSQNQIPIDPIIKESEESDAPETKAPKDGIGVTRTEFIEAYPDFLFQKQDPVEGLESYVGLKGGSFIQLMGEGERVDRAQMTLTLNEDIELAKYALTGFGIMIDEDIGAWLDKEPGETFESENYENTTTMLDRAITLIVLRQTASGLHTATLKIN